MSNMAIETVPAANLKRADRCDRCAAQALHRVAKPRANANSDEPAFELLFCDHDFKKHKDALEAGDWLVLSDTMTA